jgi:hypothetical protein
MSHHKHEQHVIPKRLWCDPCYPIRESDGEAFVPVLLDLRQVRIQQARDTALRFLRDAKASRHDGSTWALNMRVVAEQRALFGGLLRSGGRVDWRGRPSNN